MIGDYRDSKLMAAIGGTLDPQPSGDQGYIRFSLDSYNRLLFHVSSREFFSKNQHGSEPIETRIDRLDNFITDLNYKNFLDRNFLYNLETLKTDFLEAKLLREKIHMAITSPKEYDFFLKINHVRENRGMKSFLILVKFQDRDDDNAEILSLYKNGKQKHLATIGGTFDILHAGHEEYIKLAFEYADRVMIYVTSDKNVEYRKRYIVRPFEFRVEQLKSFIRSIGCENRYEIRRLHKLDDLESEHINTKSFGEKISMVVVSPEYYNFFLSLNRTRVCRNMKSFLILVKLRKRDDINSDISSSGMQGFVA
jgi:cytidyltransferase-like protein